MSAWAVNDTKDYTAKLYGSSQTTPLVVATAAQLATLASAL